MSGLMKRVARLPRDVVGAWQFRGFERGIHPETWRMHDALLAWAAGQVAAAGEGELPKRYAESDDPLVQQGYALVRELRQTYCNRHASLAGIRVLLHVPAATVSAGGHSVFSNMAEALRFLGLPVLTFGEECLTDRMLDRFGPTVLLISDYLPFWSAVDWQALERYRKQNRLLLGLTASLEEYGNSPLPGRLERAQARGVDFFFTFRSQRYVTTRRAYAPFFEQGFRIVSFEFGVNPLVYYPVPAVERDIPYVFLASSNRDKLSRYRAFLGELFRSYPGFIDGPGWSAVGSFRFDANRDRYLYARARVGINLHLPEQIEWACELNERTYMLAACGTPQVVDNPKLLNEYFSPDAFFVAATPQEYLEAFEGLLVAPDAGERAALKAQREVFAQHTTFHRGDRFIASLISIMDDLQVSGSDS